MISPFLAYHEISERGSEYFYSIPKDSFREHARCLKRFSQCQRTPVKAPRVTFDDGHVSQYVHGLPVLQELSLQAFFFVTVEWIGSRKGYMTWPQLRELAKLGHEVQSHGWSHSLLTQCSMPQLKFELDHSKKTLEDRLGISVDAISMPGGRWNHTVYHACRENGYGRVFTSDPFFAARRVSLCELHGRLMVSRNMTTETISSLLEGRGIVPHLYFVKHLAGKSARKVLGSGLYGLLWRHFSNKRESQEERARLTEPQTGKHA